MLFNLNQLNWFWQTLTSESQILRAILPRTILFAALAMGVAYFHQFKPILELNVVGSLTTNVACNLVLGLLLVFRTNAAYERFCQGRQAWGILTVEIRNLSREIQITILETDEEYPSKKTTLLKLLVGFAIATKLHLRQQKITTELDEWLSPQILDQCRQAKNPPLQISLWIRNDLQQITQHQTVTPVQQMIMLNQLNRLIEGLTCCERIVATTTPPAYVNFLRKLIMIYCFLLPFSLIDQLNWWVGFAVAVIASVLLGVDEIGSQMDSPFGNDSTDLPLDEICGKIMKGVESTISFVSENQTSTETNSSGFVETALRTHLTPNPTPSTPFNSSQIDFP